MISHNKQMNNKLVPEWWSGAWFLKLHCQHEFRKNQNQNQNPKTTKSFQLMEISSFAWFKLQTYTCIWQQTFSSAKNDKLFWNLYKFVPQSVSFLFVSIKLRLRQAPEQTSNDCLFYVVSAVFFLNQIMESPFKWSEEDSWKPKWDHIFRLIFL